MFSETCQNQTSHWIWISEVKFFQLIRADETENAVYLMECQAGVREQAIVLILVLKQTHFLTLT